MDERRLYGLMAEFDDPEALLHAAQRTYVEGYRALDAFTPYPVHGLSEAIGFRRTILPYVVLAGGLAGGIGGFLLQYWTSVVSYPLNIGGRPYNSWPAFVPVTFELTILGAAFAAVLGMLLLNGLPMPYHPAFNVPNFQLATRDRFFLLVQATDPKFDRTETARFLGTLGARDVAEVEP
jgi:hypothetical protein